ncbi:MAG TPA: carboxypeptidase-like regulatory domain-containing protein, partial [Thermoanaerobaculia bacterium]|nr:carboxypeptidase-like regulatory domain-containing protein [Thermoanaerobaculia bacterium]
MIVIHPDFAIVDLTRQGAQLPVSFDLNAGVHVTGVVSGSDGKTPAAGARINIGGWNLGESSADGSFDVTRAPANAIEVLAYAGKTSGRATRKGSDKLVIRLMPDASLRGRVIDIKRKSPLSGASISFRPAQSFFRMGFSFSVVSGSKGDFVFDRIAPGVYEVDVTLPGYSISHRTITIPAGASLSSDLTAVRSGVLSGTVVDEDKRVVPGAPIMMVEKNYPIFFGSEAKAYSDPGGRYLVRAVEPDHELVAMVRKSGEPEARSTAFRLAPGERRDKMIITIPRGLTLRGKVVDVAGKPLAAVRIIASAQTENSQWEWPEMLRSWEDGRLTPQTEPDGTFSLRLKEATYLVGFRLPGYALQEARNVRVDRDLEPLKIVMERGASISGRVQHAGTGTPVAEAYVLIPEQPMPPVITAADGSFTINDLEPGEMLIRASKPQESVSVQKQVTAPSENVVMEVPRGETISGRVLARSSGSPVTDFQAGLRTGRMVLAPLTIHSADGTFTLDNVMVGSIDLVITAPGFVAKRVRGLNVEEGKPIKDLEVLVEPGVHLSGTVTGPDDEALSDVYIQAQKKDSGANTEDLGYSGVPRTSTDNAGTFSLDALEPGEKIVIFRKQGFATERRAVNLEGKDARVDVKLSKGHMLQGRVITSEGAPVADAQVNAYAPGSESYSSAKTDAGGQFTLEGLSALRYTVEAQKTGFASTSKKDIDAATVTSLELVLDRGARVHGAVRGATRKQLDQATVSARGGRSFSESPVSGDGTFRMEGVATGTVKVALDISGTGGSRSVPPKTIEVAAGADVEVNFDLQPGSVVRGRVTLEGKAVS